MTTAVKKRSIQAWHSIEARTGSVLDDMTFGVSAGGTSPDVISNVDATIRQIEAVLERVAATSDVQGDSGRNLGLLVRLLAAWLEGLNSTEVAQALGWNEESYRKVLHGERKVQSSHAERLLLLSEIIQTLGRVIDRNATGRWFKTPVPALGNATPLEALRKRKGTQVLNVVQSYLDPSYG